MTTGQRPICVGCAHFKPAAATLVCVAYPAGIPDAILRNVADHRRPQPGDQGIRFRPKSADDAAYAVEIFGPLRRA
jgi:hypothetical protein